MAMQFYIFSKTPLSSYAPSLTISVALLLYHENRTEKIWNNDWKGEILAFGRDMHCQLHQLSTFVLNYSNSCLLNWKLLMDRTKLVLGLMDKSLIIYSLLILFIFSGSQHIWRSVFLLLTIDISGTRCLLIYFAYIQRVKSSFMQIFSSPNPP